jgi:hypothetical protein
MDYNPTHKDSLQMVEPTLSLRLTRVMGLGMTNCVTLSYIDTCVPTFDTVELFVSYILYGKGGLGTITRILCLSAWILNCD